MSDVTILHSLRCTTSRATLALLNDRGIESDIVDDLIEPPSAEEWTKIIGMLGRGARGVIRTEEPKHLERALDHEKLAECDLIAAMCTHPRLIQRPIVVTKGKAAMGRPPGAVLEIL